MKLLSGLSCRKIAKGLNLDRIPTPSQYALQQGKKIAKYSEVWSDSRIREIIQNEVYIGNMVQGRMKKVNYKSKNNIRLPKEEWKIVKQTHDSIIDIKTFRKANSMLALRKHTRIKSHDYLLKGLVHCHECGKKMYCSSRHLACGTRYYFRCSTYLSSEKKSCISHSLRMDLLEDLVINILNRIVEKYHNSNMFNTIFHKLYSSYYVQINNEQQNINYKNMLTTLAYEIDKLYDDKLRGIIDDTDFKRIYNTKKKMQINIRKKAYCTKILNCSTAENMVKITEDKFKNSLKIDRKILTDFIEKIEIDSSKKIYIFLKFKTFN